MNTKRIKKNNGDGSKNDITMLCTLFQCTEQPVCGWDDLVIGVVREKGEDSFRVFARFEKPMGAHRVLVVDDLCIYGVTHTAIRFDRTGNATVQAKEIDAHWSMAAPSAPDLHTIPVADGDTFPWTVLDRCAQLAAEGEELDPREFVSLAASLVGLVACDQECRAAARQGYAALVRRHVEAVSPWSLVAGSTSALLLGLPPPNRMAAYCVDRLRGTFVRLLPTGAEIAPTTPEWALLRRALGAAKHRNGTPHKESVLFALPLVYGTARAALGCRTCAANTHCTRTHPSLLAGGVALVTVADIRCACGALAARHFDAMVARGQFATGAAGIAKMCRSGGGSGAAGSVSAAVGVHVGRLLAAPGVRFPHRLRQDADELAARLEWARRQLQCRHGLSLETFLADPLFAQTVARLAPGGGTAQHGAPAAGHASLVPGYAELAATGWSMAALRPFVPPCIGRVLDACFSARHPNYAERRLVGSLMCQIAGLEADPEAFYAAWASMFQHPEPTCALYGRLGTFERSRYGRISADDVRLYRQKGKCCGCPHAMSKGLCPFAAQPASEARMAMCEAEAARRSRVGAPHDPAAVDAVVHAAFAAESPSPPRRCRMQCMNYLYATHGPELVRWRPDAVSSPTWFYMIAWARDERQGV